MVRLFAAFNGATFTQCVQLFVNIYRKPLGTCGIYYVVSDLVYILTVIGISFT